LEAADDDPGDGAELREAQGYVRRLQVFLEARMLRRLKATRLKDEMPPKASPKAAAAELARNQPCSVFAAFCAPFARAQPRARIAPAPLKRSRRARAPAPLTNPSPPPPAPCPPSPTYVMQITRSLPCRMTPLQRSLSIDLLARDFDKVNALARRAVERKSMSNTLLRLRQVAMHPFMMPNQEPRVRAGGRGGWNTGCSVLVWRAGAEAATQRSACGPRRARRHPGSAR
jgi:hypothetical protein